jgi:hypothetical protein
VEFLGFDIRFSNLRPGEQRMSNPLHYYNAPSGNFLLSKIGVITTGAGIRESRCMTTIRSKCIFALAGLSWGTLVLGVVPAAAVEQCRFIQARAERESCYQRQEAELAAKRKPEPKRDRPMEALQQMKQEDQELDRQIHGICRGC